MELGWIRDPTGDPRARRLPAPRAQEDRLVQLHPPHAHRGRRRRRRCSATSTVSMRSGSCSAQRSRSTTTSSTSPATRRVWQGDRRRPLGRQAHPPADLRALRFRCRRAVRAGALCRAPPGEPAGPSGRRGQAHPARQREPGTDPTGCVRLGQGRGGAAFDLVRRARTAPTSRSSARCPGTSSSELSSGEGPTGRRVPIGLDAVPRSRRQFTCHRDDTSGVPEHHSDGSVLPSVGSREQRRPSRQIRSR